MVRKKTRTTYLDHLLLSQIALLGLLDSMRKLSKCWRRRWNTAHLGCCAQVGDLLRLLLQMGRLRGGRLLKTHLTWKLCVLLLLGLYLMLRLLLLLELLLRHLRLNHLLRTHHLYERILIVGHHAIGELRLLLGHERLELLLVQAGRQAELGDHGIALLHLMLRAGWWLWLRWLLLLLLLLLWHLCGLLHLVLP